MVRFLDWIRRRIVRGLRKGTLGLPGEVVAVVGRGHTGRKFTADVDYAVAAKWAAQRRRWLLPYVRAAWRFRKQLRGVAALQANVMTCYRGRPDDGTIADWETIMGPPPAERTPAGRYNRRGTPVLYLCDSEEGVRLELASSRGGLCIQEYRADLKAVRLADLASPDLPNFIKAVFDFAESCNVEGRPGPADYLFSQVVAEIVRQAGFDGMVIPGVRGNEAHQYRNVVVFEPSGCWRQWSTRDAGFKRVT